MPVVVGFEDAERSCGPLMYAAREARVRQAPLRLIRTGGGRPEAADRVVARLRADFPGLVVTAAAADGEPTAALSAASRDASLLVLGDVWAGRAPNPGPGREPVAFHALTLAACPVMVVRGDTAPTIRRIMAGVDVDAPRDSAEVLRFAVAEGLLHHAEVYAIHVWEDPEHLFGTDARRPDPGPGVPAVRHARLAAILEPWERKYPDLVMAREVFPGSPGHLLVAATRLTDTLVIGGRARRSRPDAGGAQAASMRIGALADTVLRHATCPVTMVPVG